MQTAEFDGPARVLVVDDEADVRLLLRRILEAEGFQVFDADGALSATHELGAAQPPDIVLLDIGLPGVDGMEVLTRIRRGSDVPVIMLTGRGEQEDRVAGLRGGADDYVVKPFIAEELLARIESVLRRSGPTNGHSTKGHAADGLTSNGHDERGQSQTADPALEFPGLTIDAAAREVHVAGERVPMTAREFDLLLFLARSPRQVFTREQLLHHVWDSSSEWQDDATVTEHVRRIRHKIEVDPDEPTWVVTVRGVGYRFEP
jgi:DNA-binding response OmpR family regulator